MVRGESMLAPSTGSGLPAETIFAALPVRALAAGMRRTAAGLQVASCPATQHPFKALKAGGAGPALASKMCLVPGSGTRQLYTHAVPQHTP